MSKERTGDLGKFNTKKWGIIGAILIVLIALIAGIAIYNTPANRLSRQLDLGNRYLEEQNYEQAIVEFDKAILIDPMSVEAYLGKAEAYVGMDDLQSALNTLQTGYDLTGDERLKAKIDEVQVQLDQMNQSGEVAQPMGEVEETEIYEEQNYIEFPFSFSNIKIKGYDLLEPHFEEVAEAFGCPLELDNVGVDDMRTQYGIMNVNQINNYQGKTFTYLDINDDGVGLGYNCGEFFDGQDLFLKDFSGDSSFFDNIQAVSGLPIALGDTYEECCKNLGADIIKEAPGSSYADAASSYMWVLHDGLLHDSITGETVSVKRIEYSESNFTEDVYGQMNRSIKLESTLFNDDGYQFSWFIRINFVDEVARSIEVFLRMDPDVE